MRVWLSGRKRRTANALTRKGPKVRILQPAPIQQDRASYLAYYFVYKMQGYRSGHNEAVLKTAWGNPRGFESHPLRQNSVRL